MNVLSLFDGMSCGQIALNRAGIKYENYLASETDKWAIHITGKNFPKTKQIGDAKDIDGTELPKIDLLLGGSPCQGFSFAGKQLNFNDPRSVLFFEYVRILKEIKPKYFLFENVKMKREYQDIITKYLEVMPIEINSSLVSAQNRKRLYWTNIPNIGQPEDKNILLKDILEEKPEKVSIVPDRFMDRLMGQYRCALETSDKKSKNPSVGEREKNVEYGDYALCVKSGGPLPVCFSTSGRGDNGIDFRFSKNEKSHTLTAGGFSLRSFSGVMQLNPSKEAGGKQPHIQNRVYDYMGKSPALKASFASRINVLSENIVLRRLTPIECERLQTVPDNYTEGVSNTQRYKMLGNGWTVDVIAHILRGLRI